MKFLLLFVILFSIGLAARTKRNNDNTENYQTPQEMTQPKQDKEAVSHTSEFKNMADSYKMICNIRQSQYVCGDGSCCCRDKNRTAICNGSLTYIPKFPSSTSRLIYVNNELRHWSKSTFENISNIETLSLKKNRLCSCSNDTFIMLKSLKKLNISDENVTMNVFQTCLGSISSRKFVSVGLKYNTIQGKRPGEIFKGMVNSTVSQISMNHTDMGIFNTSEYKKLKHLQFLSFLSCWLQTVILDTPLPKVTQLIFSSNSITQFPKFCTGETVFPNLSILRLDSNFIRFLPVNGFQCMKKLVEISIAKNPLLSIEPNTFSNLPVLHTIIMNSITIMSIGRKFIIKKYAFNSSSLTHLFLRGLNLPPNLVKIDPRAFQACPNLQVLYIPDHKFNFSEKQFDQLFNGMENLKELSLTNTGISFLPQVISRSMQKLETLFVDSNEITGWQAGYFDSLVSLKRLDLCCNQLSTVNKSSFSFVNYKNFITLDLSRNPYSCTCSSLLWLTKLMKSKAFTRLLKYFPWEYTCSSPSELDGEMITRTRISDRLCLLNSHVSLIIIMICIIALVLVLLTSLVYRYRWHIRYRLYMMRYYHTRYQQLLQEGSRYNYDVYLSCCDDDLSFVMNILMPHLEQTMGQRVFLPSRDGLGQTSISCATRNIDACKKVVICVSNAYSIDSYCEFETEMACDRVINERCSLVVVILLEEVYISRMTKTLHKILKVDNYIKWDGTEEGIGMFWEKLTRCLDGPSELRQ